MFEDAEKRVTKKGFVTYWKDGVMIGRKCTKCGEDKPISEFGICNSKKNQYRADCKKCHSKQNLLYEQNNSEKVKESRKKYYQDNIEKYKEWYRKNWERHREHNRQWVRNNPEKNRAKSRKWARENPEYEKEYHERLRTENIQKITNMLHQINPTFKQLNLPVYGYIYMFENIKTGHKYVGQSTLPIDRRYKGGIIQGWIKERLEKDTQKFKEELIEEDIKLIEMLDVAFCKWHLDKLEAYYINKYDSCNNGYNNQPGNHNTDDGKGEFEQILAHNNLQFIDGKLTKKVM